MQANPHQQVNINLTNFINNVLTDLKNLTNSLRSVSRSSADINNALINRLLLGNDRDSLQLSKDILSHLLHIVQYKGISTLIMSILTKVIGFVKIIDESEAKSQQKMFQRIKYSQQMNAILYHIIDIVFLLKNKYKEIDMALRIIQTTFSLIDTKILQYANENLFIRIYSICFDCCLSNPVIQNISVSALFALTEIIFSTEQTQASLSILNQFLEYLFKNKKYTWLKQVQFKGIVWDLIIVAIKNYPTQQMDALSKHQNIKILINQMYQTSMQKVFLHIQQTKTSNQTSKTKKQNDKNINFKKGSFPDFIRYYKSFIYFSIHLSIRPYPQLGEIVPFRQNLHLFKVLNELERGTKLYILLQGISLLIIEGNYLLVEDDKGIILLDVICKISQQLCLSLVPLDLTSDSKDFYLEKMCGDFTKINDSDHARLIKNLIIKLRKKFQKTIQNKLGEAQLKSQRSQLSQKSQAEANEPKPMSEKKRWQKLIKTIISIIRYLTSLNMNQGVNEQVVRKLIIQFQYWFLVCPSNKTRNLILQQLLNTSTLMDNKLQAIKVSQCVQLGSNIIYGYYDVLDSLGLTIIIKMMAGVKTSWEEGKGFQQLDEVCSMSQKLYSQQRLVHNQKSYMKTIQAIVQSANSMLADLQQPSKQEQRIKKIGKNSQDKFLKLIDYIFSKLNFILEQNIEYLSNEWNFVTGFWITFCSNKNGQIQAKTMSHIGNIIPIIVKKSEINQQLILSTYIQLAKLHIVQICKLIIQHIKLIISSINKEEGILQLFRIMKIIIDNKENKVLFQEIYELQEMIIKEALFKIKSIQKIISIIDSITILNNDKNEEYKVVNLIWSIFDHMKLMSANKQIQQSQPLWMKLFNKIYLLALYSAHGETKQSCIHTCTQLLAESTNIIDVQLFSAILKQIYMPLFFVSLGIHQKSTKIENIAQAEMMKVGIKNFSKIIKKCINEQIHMFRSIINETNIALLDFINRKGNELSIQYVHELCSYFQFLKSLKQMQSVRQQIDFRIVTDILSEIQKNHGNFDKTTVYWRKKYQPVFIQIQQYFTTH